MQHQENNTGLPDTLKVGIESLSGLSMDDVHVHYHSSKPAQVQALAYTQGPEIYVGPGQEQYLAHEAWHVVQQKQGRVQPTFQAKGVAINDDQELEREADVMGAKIGEIGAQVIQVQGIYCSKNWKLAHISRQYGNAILPTPILQKYQIHPNVPYTHESIAQDAFQYRIDHHQWNPHWIEPPYIEELRQKIPNITSLTLYLSAEGPNIASLAFDGYKSTRESAGIHSEQLLIGEAIQHTTSNNPENPAQFRNMNRGSASLYTEMAPCPACATFLAQALTDNDHVYYSVPYDIQALASLVTHAKEQYEREETEALEIEALMNRHEEASLEDLLHEEQYGADISESFFTSMEQ